MLLCKTCKKITDLGDFPGGAVVKNPPANAGDMGSSPGPGRSHMPQSNKAHVPQLLSLRSIARKPQYRARVPQLLKPECLEPMLNKRTREATEQKQEELQSCSLWNENHIHRKTDKMKRQRTMYQMKEQDKTSEKQLNEVEIGNLPEKEFRIMIVRMIQDLGKRMEAKIEKMQEMFNKDLEELKNKQTDEQYNN